MFERNDGKRHVPRQLRESPLGKAFLSDKENTLGFSSLGSIRSPLSHLLKQRSRFVMLERPAVAGRKSEFAMDV